jgi:hypothetical protein
MLCTPDKTGRCTTCGDTLSTSQESTDAERIAQLTAELAESYTIAEMQLGEERAAHERTKAERDEARQNARADLQVTKSIADERDAAQAEAAAMREALAMLIDVAHYVAGSAQLNATPSFRDHLMRAATKGILVLDALAALDGEDTP